MAMTRRQRRFVDEYLVDLNATQAAIRAGYSPAWARGNAHKLVADGCTAELIAQRQQDLIQRVRIKQEDVVNALAAIAFADAADYTQVERVQAVDPVTGQHKVDEYGKPIMIDHVRITPTDTLTARQRKAVACIKEGRYGIEVQLADKLKALELLGRHLGVFGSDNPGTDVTQVVIVGSDQIAD